MNDITQEELNEYHSCKNADDVIQNYQKGIEEIDKIEALTGLTIVSGAMLNFDNGITTFLNKLNDKTRDLFLLSEVTGEFRRYTGNKIHFPFICTPHLLAKEMVVQNVDIELTSDMKDLYTHVIYVREAVDNIQARQLHLGNGYAKAWGYYSYRYLNALLDKLRPKKVVLWNGFYAFHHIFKGICQERHIPLEYMEFGCIPGTFCIEASGQQGESIVAVEYDSFNRKSISHEDIVKAEKVLKFLRSSALNRNLQPNNQINLKALRNYKVGRRTLFYVGQNDYESGMFPYTQHSKMYHSPIFSSSLEALEYLELLCIKNKWNLIYKTHPIISYLGIDEGTDRLMTDVVDKVDINSVIDASDLIITILSQAAYTGLIRKKPVLLLGYMQLKGKGCAYETYNMDEIEAQIKKALRYGLTEKQKDNFRKHVARLLKYYLYDDGVEREIRYGMEVDK